MVNYHPGEVLLAHVIFTTGRTMKQRPVLVLLDTGDADVVVAPNTSQAARASFDITLKDWQQASLAAPSIVRLHKPMTIEKQTGIRSLGVLAAGDWAQVRGCVKQLWAGI